MLAVRVIQDQGIEVEGINFYTGFCVEGHTAILHNKDKIKRNNVLWVAEQLGIKLNIVDISNKYKNILLNPKYGYGKNLNPCLDCKIFMVQQTYELLQKNNFDFIITGEVVGQRPMSQRADTMPVVAHQSGAADLLVRPLSARNLPPTKPEIEGWIKRDKMSDFSGRSRAGQMALAKKFNIKEYAQPAGGCCFLTDANYSAKLSDMWQHRGSRDYELDDIIMLKVGRHLRPAKNYKIIVARDEAEGNYMAGYKNNHISLEAEDKIPGALCLIEGQPNDDDLQQAASICAYFGKGRDLSQVTINIQHLDGKRQQLKVAPIKINKNWFIINKS
ncbi:MAG: tRNA (5-methylaminomethyl-2-thiouridylate)-methyltransferase [Gammaproteobacteria bacterium]|nr:MAG: tRNA (5-methylaminomethyl-2-thiouridylate)-methyltransferase [Gammaproteobacteria bacterium]